MITEHKPPLWPKLSEKAVRLFLAGSIEQGTAEMWQDRIVDELKKSTLRNDVDIFNPRRDNWDPSWPNDPAFDEFREQVTWELDHIDSADVVFFWFDPNTKSPITLLELGIVLNSEQYVVIYCPKEFYRYGNVKITANHFGETVYTDPDQAIEALSRLLQKPHKRIYVD